MADVHFELVTPEKKILSEDAYMVVVPGTEGDFGVLAGHAPAVSALRPGIMTVYVGGNAQRMVVLGGFAEVSADGKLTVLADLADSVEDFNRDVLAERIVAQEEKIKEMEIYITEHRVEIFLVLLDVFGDFLGISWGFLGDFFGRKKCK